MKHRSKFALLPGLVLLTWLLAIYSRQPVRETVSIATSAESSNAIPRAPRPDMTAAEDGTSADKSGEEFPLFESSWAKELRELKELAAEDPDAALAEVAHMSDKHERKAAAWVVCLLLAPKDPETAMTAAWSLELGKSADESDNASLESLAKQWANANLMEAFVWASALPADEEWRRDRVMKGIASVLSQFAPAEAARLVEEYINPDSNVKMDAAIEVLQRWAARDFIGALDWVARAPEGPIRDREIEELARVGPGQPQPEAEKN